VEGKLNSDLKEKMRYVIDMNREKIIDMFEESIEVKKQIINSELIDEIDMAAKVIINSYKNGGKVLICGNGGSAADSQHVAGELINKFRIDRKPLGAIALSTDTSVLTSIGNDFSFDDVFKKQVQGNGKEGDVLIGISTSGNSKNVIAAIDMAKRIGMKTITLTGSSGGKLNGMADICLKVPSNDTPRIQESHITILHIICDLVEQELFAK